ncbi:MAG: HotDog domain-containing protein [Piptocephalis tieghemiana]|nr:MAG: HotDog domain-containing protein [Piptocephalis tieghemiana]
MVSLLDSSDSSHASYHSEVQSTLSALDLVKKLREDPSVNELDLLSFFDALPPKAREDHLTLSTLRGLDGLSTPLVFEHTKDLETGEEITMRRCSMILFPGKKLCSHPGIIHGGMLSTIMDEALAMAAYDFDTFKKGKVGFTARLELDFRSPVPAGKPLLIEAWQDQLDGRKTWVHGRMSPLDTADSKPLHLEAKALFIQARPPPTASSASSASTDGSS